MRPNRTRSPRWARAWRCLSGSLALLLIANGCAVWDPFAPAPLPPAKRAGGTEIREYRIGVPDRLEMTVWQHPDVSGPLLVRNDGKVSVPLMGDIQAAGLTPTELAEKIRTALSDFISDPRVDIAVTEMRSQVASVIGGGVVRSGQIELQRNTRVIEAIAAMGGLTAFAKKRDIRILRNTAHGQVEYRFDYTAFIRGEAPDSNLLLEPGDTVIVPD